MGTRVIFVIKDSVKNVVATLFSNNSHDAQDPEAVFMESVAYTYGPTELVGKLLGAKYESESGNHRSGDQMFWLVAEHEARDGHRQFLFTATNVETQPGDVDGSHGSWSVQRQEVG